MNIVMFTPAAHSSAIGFAASLVVQALIANHHHVTVVRAEDKPFLDNPTHNFNEATMIGWNNHHAVSECLAIADSVVYQMGDYLGYHRGCIHWLLKVPGIICLHDFAVQNFFYEWAQEHKNEALFILKQFYGQHIADIFFTPAFMSDFQENACEHAPLTEWVASLAQGVIAHSQWGLKRVMESCSGPIIVSALPYKLTDEAQQAFDTSMNAAAIKNNDRLTVLTMGNIHENKRPFQVIEAISMDETLRSKMDYCLAGGIPDVLSERLVAFAQERKVSLTILGRVTEAALGEAIAQADIVTCLRWPSLEAASATAISAMLCGKPTIVTNTGFYAELPDDCVIKIDPKNEIKTLTKALLKLRSNKKLRSSLGNNAKKWATHTFSAEAYANDLVELSRLVLRSKPIIAAVDFYKKVLHEWGAPAELLTLDQTLNPLKIFEDTSS